MIFLIMKFLSSAKSTALLTFLMALYLIQGKTLKWSLNKDIMIAFAVVIILQSLWAVLVRVKLYRSRTLVHEELLSGCTVLSCPGGAGEVQEKLKSAGLNQLTKAGEVLFEKNLGLSVLIELLAYCSLLVVLLFGLMTYGFGVRGVAILSPGGEPVDIGTLPLSRGFLAEHFKPFLNLRAGSISDTLEDRPSELVLEVTDRQGGKVSTYRLEKDDSIEVNRLKLEYAGEYYIMFISVMRGSHDYMPWVQKLTTDQDGDEYPYSSKFYFKEHGLDGDVYYDPVQRKLRLTFAREGITEFDEEFMQDEPVKRGELRVQLKTIGHEARVNIVRFGYRTQVLAGMAGLIFFLVMRLIFRPLLLVLKEEGGDTVCRFNNKKVMKMVNRLTTSE